MIWYQCHRSLLKVKSKVQNPRLPKQIGGQAKIKIIPNVATS
jgi:hypothetical protein